MGIDDVPDSLDDQRHRLLRLVEHVDSRSQDLDVAAISVVMHDAIIKAVAGGIEQSRPLPGLAERIRAGLSAAIAGLPLALHTQLYGPPSEGHDVTADVVALVDLQERAISELEAAVGL